MEYASRNVSNTNFGNGMSYYASCKQSWKKNLKKELRFKSYNEQIELIRPKQEKQIQKKENEPIEITVVDENDWVGQVAAALRIGEISINSVDDMVDKVLKLAGQRKIKQLNIMGHGSSGFQIVGAGKGENGIQYNQVLTLSTLPQLRQVLTKLTPYFTTDAIVILEGCKVAKGNSGLKLLQELSKIWGVPVKAGIAYQRSTTPGLEGPQRTCKPPPKNYKEGESVCYEETDVTDKVTLETIDPITDAIKELKNKIIGR